MFFERRHLRAVAAVLALTMASSLTGCGTTQTASSPGQQAKNVILIIADGMQLEHERAYNNYLSGSFDSGLEHWKFDYKGAASTWDVTTYNRYAYSSDSTGAKNITDDKFDPQNSSTYSVLLGYDTSKGGKQPYPRDTTAALNSSASLNYFGTKLKLSSTDGGAIPATDSASAATALSTGFKTDDGNLAWRTGDKEDGRLTTIAEMYRNQKKAAIGVVSTVPFSHATPAGFVSHNKSRNNYKAIAQEIITAVRPEVVIGGGHPDFNSATVKPDYSYIDGPELTNLRNSTEYAFVERTAGVDGGVALLAKANQAVTAGKKLFGLFGGVGGNFEYHNPSNDRTSAVTRGSIENPTLADASTAALKVLSQNKNGFFLMVEQGDIDWSNHANDYKSMIGGMWDLDQAVKAVEAFVDQPGDDIDWSNTLVIVTSDHSNSYLRNTVAKQLGKGLLPSQQTGGVALGYNSDYYYPNGEVTYGVDGKGINSHFNDPVTLYAKGAGVGRFKSYEGSWYPGTTLIDNTQIYRVMLEDLGLTDENRSYAAKLDATVYALPDTSMKVLNPLLTDQNLTDALTYGALTMTKPGIGSGLTPDPRNPGYYYMTTDRGMNGETTAKFFPLPASTPTIAKVHFDAAGKIVVDKYIPILDKDGNYVTGMPNLAAYDDVPYLNSALTLQGSYNENGLDIEDIQVLPNGDFMLVDEYSPSIVVVDGTTGRVKVRYTPVNKPMSGANYTVKNILPSILGEQRRSNRGFENLALSSDGATAYAVMQSPIGDKSNSMYKYTRVVRIVRLNVTDPLNATVSGEFVVLQSAAGDYAKNIAGYTVSNKQTDMKYSAAQWLATDRILLLERANGKAKLMEVDMAKATNLLSNSCAGSLAPEETVTSSPYQQVGLMNCNIVPSSAREVFSTDELKSLVQQSADQVGTSPSYEIKLEGMALIDNQTLYLSNDNDFGIFDANLPTRVWKISLKRALSRF